LTERALEARLRSAKLVMELEGQSASAIDAAVPDLRQGIISSFQRSSEVERKALQAAESRWLRLLASMHGLDVEERRETLAQVRSQAGEDRSTLGIAHALEQTGSSQGDAWAKLAELNRLIDMANGIGRDALRGTIILDGMRDRTPLN
jgi:hypothetical protein